MRRGALKFDIPLTRLRNYGVGLIDSRLKGVRLRTQESTERSSCANGSSEREICAGDGGGLKRTSYLRGWDHAPGNTPFSPLAQSLTTQPSLLQYVQKAAASNSDSSERSLFH